MDDLRKQDINTNQGKIDLSTYFNSIDTRKIDIEKIINNSVKNYYIRYLTYKKCKFIYPLKFKISDKKFEFFQIEKPNNDYLILESIEPNYFYGHI